MSISMKHDWTCFPHGLELLLLCSPWRGSWWCCATQLCCALVLRLQSVDRNLEPLGQFWVILVPKCSALHWKYVRALKSIVFAYLGNIGIGIAAKSLTKISIVKVTFDSMTWAHCVKKLFFGQTDLRMMGLGQCANGWVVEWNLKCTWTSMRHGMVESKDPISSSQDPKRFELQKLVCDFDAWQLLMRVGEDFEWSKQRARTWFFFLLHWGARGFEWRQGRGRVGAGKILDTVRVIWASHEGSRPLVNAQGWLWRETKKWN